MLASNNAKTTRGRPFEKGNRHGRGRPVGSRNKAVLAAQTLLEGEAEALSRKAVELALSGDTTALRLCLERLVPVCRERFLSLGSDVDVRRPSEVIAEIVRAATRGEITPSEAQAMASVLESQRRLIETEQLQDRIAALEATLKTRKPG